MPQFPLQRHPWVDVENTVDQVHFHRHKQAFQDRTVATLHRPLRSTKTRSLLPYPDSKAETHCSYWFLIDFQSVFQWAMINGRRLL